MEIFVHVRLNDHNDRIVDYFCFRTEFEQEKTTYREIGEKVGIFLEEVVKPKFEKGEYVTITTSRVGGT